MFFLNILRSEYRQGRKEKMSMLARKLNPNIKIYQMEINSDAFKLECEAVI